jgi:hypothetical protein
MPDSTATGHIRGHPAGHSGTNGHSPSSFEKMGRAAFTADNKTVGI